MSTAELIATWARQLQCREEDLKRIRNGVAASRFQSIKRFEKTYPAWIQNYNFQPGALVLVRNSRIEMELDRKTKEKYGGPMVVVRRTPQGSYRLAELDGSVSKTSYAAFRLVPYHARSRIGVPNVHEWATEPEADEEVDA